MLFLRSSSLNLASPRSGHYSAQRGLVPPLRGMAPGAAACLLVEKGHQSPRCPWAAAWSNRVVFSTKTEIAPSGGRHRSGQADISHAGAPKWALVYGEIISQCPRTSTKNLVQPPRVFLLKNEIAPSGVCHRSGQADISHAGVPRWTLESREIICQSLPVTEGSYCGPGRSPAWFGETRQ